MSSIAAPGNDSHVVARMVVVVNAFLLFLHFVHRVPQSSSFVTPLRLVEQAGSRAICSSTQGTHMFVDGSKASRRAHRP